MLHSLLICVFALFLELFIFYSFHGEDICWFWPEIDTVFAPHFSKGKFDEIQTGMCPQDVIGLIGNPISVAYRGAQREEWGYSHDGALGRFGDKAWFYYGVLFIDGVVADKMVKVYYD